MSILNKSEETETDVWWESGPVFSTKNRGSNITTISPGQSVGRFTLGLGAAAVWSAAVWAALAYLAFPRMLEHEVVPSIAEAAKQWWWVFLIAALVILMFGSTTWLYDETERRFGQQTTAFALAGSAASAGIAAAGVLHLVLVSNYLQSQPAEVEAWKLPDATIVLIFTVAALLFFAVGLLCLPFVIWRARRQQRMIVRIRQTGRRYQGELTQVAFRNEWIAGRPQFRVQVRYDTPDGSRLVQAAMATSSERVPLGGSPVIVLVDARGDTLIEPDPERPLAFDPQSERYHEPSGGGS